MQDVENCKTLYNLSSLQARGHCTALLYSWLIISENLGSDVQNY